MKNKINFKSLGLLRLLWIGVFLSCTAFASYAQITINVQDKPIRQIIRTIEKKTDYRFFYNDDFSALDKVKTLNVKNVSIDDALKALFSGSGISWEKKDKKLIVLTPANVAAPKTMSSINNEQHQVSGVVTDEAGTPIIGANVLIKRSNKAATTDARGRFSLTASEDDVFSVSYIGYLSQERIVGQSSNLTIKLVENTKALNEIVVVGFGTQKKINLTGSVGTVSSKDLISRPAQNATQMLEGIVPGLNITQNMGNLSSTPTINIRGTATIGYGSTGSPLVLIDGMEGDINALNPQDIDNISVLKDVSSSSIYGSRAPFGVILITTKKGKAGRCIVNYNNTFRQNSPVNMPHMMDSYAFATYFNEANVNSGASPYFSNEWLQRIKDYRDGILTTVTTPYSPTPQYWATGYNAANANTDMFKEIYRLNAPSQEHNVSFSGGNDRTQYYVSSNYLAMDGLMTFNQDKFKRYTNSVKITTKLTDYASLSVNNRWIRQDSDSPTNMVNLYSVIGRIWPTNLLYDPNGYLSATSVTSPALAIRDGGDSKSQNDWLYQQAQLTLEPIKGWKTFAELNYRTYDVFNHTDIQKTYNHDVSGNPYLINTTSSVEEYASRRNYINTNVYSEYSTQINKIHDIKVMVGHQAERNKYRTLDASRQGIMVSSLPVLDLTSGTDNSGKVVAPSVSGQYQNWATEGYFGRLNYDYDGKYLMEMNLRYDGTSRFRSDKRWQWFPSASIGWNMDREKFFEPLTGIVNHLKFRASYGELGNQNTSSWYPTYVTMPVGTANSSWLVNGAQQNTSSAPSLVSQSMTWERIQNWNVGMDASFFNNRLTLTADCYNRKTLDMIGPAPELPTALGTSVPTMNNTDLKTYGFELSIGWNDRLENGLGYSARINLSDSRTKILRFPNPTGTLSTYRAGQEMGEIWGYQTIGIAKTQEEMDSYLASLPNGGQKAVGTKWSAGDIMYKDLSGDGKVDNGASTIADHGDMKVIGNSTARFPFSIDLSADWKGFDFRALFQGIGKRDYFQGSYYFWGACNSGLWWSTALKEHQDYFRPEGTTNPYGANLDSYYPRPLFGDWKDQQCQTRYLQDASYIRLKNLQFGYTLPTEFTTRFKIEKLRIFVSGENIWTLTNLSTIFDPETIDGGYGGNVYPLCKVYSAGLSINF